MKEEYRTTAVPMGQEVVFGFGMLANQLFSAALGVFIISVCQVTV